MLESYAAIFLTSLASSIGAGLLSFFGIKNVTKAQTSRLLSATDLQTEQLKGDNKDVRHTVVTSTANLPAQIADATAKAVQQAPSSSPTDVKL